jgi:prolipoprotein diacylglyceryltransferase
VSTDFIPSPSSNGLRVGPLFIHAYGLTYVVALLAAVTITCHRWAARAATALVNEVALWGFPRWADRSWTALAPPPSAVS